MNSAFVFVLYKGPTCILIAFVHISFGLYFKNNGSFCIIHCKASRYIVHLNINLIKFDQIKFLDLISCQQVF